MTRLWRTSDPITVEATPQGKPLRFVWKAETYEIESVTQWRTDTDWWAARLWRDYFQVVTTTGQLAIIYRDLVEDTWWWQRIYD